MDEQVRERILAILTQNTIMSLATLRPDGWPQATTVGFAHDGLTLFFLCGPDSQKAHNIARDGRVSLTINGNEAQVMQITGLSMAAHAEVVSEPAEAGQILELIMSRYPAQETLPGPVPDPADVCIVRLRPVVISLIDYTRGFGHTELIAV